MISFSLDTAGILQTASDFFAGLFPILVFPLGITLGLGLLAWVSGAVRKAIGKAGGAG